MSEILRIEKLVKSFQTDFWKPRTKVLNELTFSVQKGSLCGFLGPNGAGKTTMIKILLRFLSSDSGEIIFHESMGNTWNEIRSNIGYFPERPYFYPHLKGIEFAHYIGRLQGLDNKTINEKTRYWAKRLSIDHALDRKIKDYSKGMLQRLGFTVSIIHDPSILILDEPLSGLDPIGRRDFKRIMVESCEGGTTVFFSSHIVADVEEVCDHVVVLMDGVTFYEGKIDQLIEDNHHGKYEFFIHESDKDRVDFEMLELGRKVGDSLYGYTVLSKNKEEFLKFLMDKNIEINSFKPLRPTLEEIVYTSRNQ